jgi:hypothetical protein
VYKLHIQNEKVRINLSLIVETIRHQRRVPQKHQEQRQTTLEFALDLKTGLLHLHSAQDLQSIVIYLDLDKQEVKVTKKRHGMFNMEGMDPKGRQVLSETCHYLKSALKHLHNIQELAHCEFEPSTDEITGRNLLHESWHAVEREDAELMLLNTSPGTYLFRKDRFAGVMEEILSAAKKSRIKCFTLTYLDPKRQVRDKTIVTWKDHWLFYDDDPTLAGNYFQSLEELLNSLGTVLKRPLPALKINSTTVSKQ